MTNPLEQVTSVPRLQRRPRDSNKGNFGHVLIVGGSVRMSGAVSLAAHGALRGGAGLVEFAAPALVQPTIAGLCPCAISFPLACDREGRLAFEATAQLGPLLERATVIAVGPGMDIGSPQQNVLHVALGQEKPLVIDADGLNNLSRIEGWPSLRRCPLVLTPHPGEFARLTGKTVREIQADRVAATTTAVREWIEASHRKPQTGDLAEAPLVCVLKGAGTVVADGRRFYVNSTGNPGMATGGTGDVLTGLTAALLAQGLAPFDAACLAVWAHGRAGDLASAQVGEVSLIASDLIDHLPAALQEAV